MGEAHSRRSVLAWIGGGTAAIALGAAPFGGACRGALGDGPPADAGPGSTVGTRGWTAGPDVAPVPDPKVAIARNADPAALVDAAVEALGGMGRFVPAGSKVLVKPNIGWDRAPELGANTNPEVVARVVALCLAAGAARVTVLDRTCNDARRCYANSGIEAAAKAAGARVVHADDARARTVDLGGEVLHDWAVYDEVLDVDVRINVPVAKHHGLSSATLGMKNWMGCVGGARDRMHQDIHRCVVDLARYFAPTLTILDAYRVMLRGGPAGRNPDDVALMRTLCAGTDPVAVDAFGASLFGLGPDDLPSLAHAEARGLGVRDLSSVPIRELDLGA